LISFQTFTHVLWPSAGWREFWHGVNRAWAPFDVVVLDTCSPSAQPLSCSLSTHTRMHSVRSTTSSVHSSPIPTQQHAHARQQHDISVRSSVCSWFLCLAGALVQRALTHIGSFIWQVLSVSVVDFTLQFFVTDGSHNLMVLRVLRALRTLSSPRACEAWPLSHRVRCSSPTAHGTSSFAICVAVGALRFLRTAKRWAALARAIEALGLGARSLGNLFVITFLFLFILAIVGMQVRHHQLHPHPHLALAPTRTLACTLTPTPAPSPAPAPALPACAALCRPMRPHLALPL
jgi:hypothetical protein